VLFDRLRRRWAYRAAVRAEHTLEPTVLRRLDRWPERRRDRAALRAERRRRPHDIGGAIQRAQGTGWGGPPPP
jgi:hypothetical protein